MARKARYAASRPPLRPEDHQQPRAEEEGRTGRHDLDKVIRQTYLLASAGAFWT